MLNEPEEIKKKKVEWEENTVQPALKRFLLTESPTRFYTPADVGEIDFLNQIGFPGQYPFTAGAYPTYPYRPAPRSGYQGAPGLKRTSIYAGYGSPEDSRDFYLEMRERGQKGGPNLAFDLPTQCGYDSDNRLVRGEVGKTGMALDTLRDFEVLYEAFVGEMDLDRIASNFTVNADSNIVVAMYFALAEKRGISPDKLRGTPQNDILKEFIARGTYIFPPKPSMRMVRDSIVFFNKYYPKMNINQLGGYHIRAAGATREQELAYSLAILIAYLQQGVNAGIDIDSFAPRFTINSFGGSMDFFKEIAFYRATRRMWAKIIKERFGAKKERSMIIRQVVPYCLMGNENCTVQRPLIILHVH